MLMLTLLPWSPFMCSCEHYETPSLNPATQMPRILYFSSVINLLFNYVTRFLSDVVVHLVSDNQLIIFYLNVFILQTNLGIRGQLELPPPPPHSGALCRSERLAKYNQLLRIEEKLGKGAKFAGEKFHNPLS